MDRPAPQAAASAGTALIRCAKAAAWRAGAPPLGVLPSPQVLVEAARAEHAAAIVGRTVRELATCPEALRSELERIDRGAWATHVVTRAALGPVLGNAAAAGMRVVAYKGAALAARFYDEPWTRAMTDVDVLISSDDEPRFHTLLAQHGFTALTPPVGRTWSVRASHERTFVPAAEGARLIDVHTAPAQPARYRFPIADMLRRAEPGSLFEAPVHFLTPADELLVMAANQAHDHYRFGLLRYLDAWLIVERAAVDWDALVATAHETGVASAVWLTLTNALRIAAATVPAPVLERLRPSPLRQAWLGTAFDLEGSGEPRHALPRRVEQLALLYPTLDRPRDFARFALVHGARRMLDAGAAALDRFGKR